MEVIDETRRFAKERAEKYGVPSFPHTEYIATKGVELARKLGADEKIVELGCYLIDIDLGKALKQGKQEEHVNMGVETANTFLRKFDLSRAERDKVLNCIAAHHGQMEHSCIESEIVKNADNYKFLSPTGIVISLFYRPKEITLKQEVDILKQKLEEKHKLATLAVCKREAEVNYKIIKRFLDAVID
ncbi:MAG: HDIG domain-containing protein [Candidatus Marsarchaeota archaeon]|nr:HDIG domain-containing protein [Candidatus Marsarchaeota archaeon]